MADKNPKRTTPPKPMAGFRIHPDNERLTERITVALVKALDRNVVKSDVQRLIFEEGLRIVAARFALGEPMVEDEALAAAGRSAPKGPKKARAR